jgi:choline dehydrogenase-like flavoprotein
VVEFETDKTGQRVTEARVACLNGTHFSVRAKRFVLATGGIENARLLLLSNRGHPNGLGNRHDLVGRFFMEHPALFSCDFVPSDPALFDRMGFYDVHPANGAMIGGRLALTEALMRQEQLLNVSVTLFPALRGERSAARTALRKLRGHFHDKMLSVETLRLLGKTAFGIGGLLGYGYRRFVRGDRPVLDGWSRLAEKPGRFGSFEAIMHLEQTPDPENRVMLGTERDALGLPKVELHWRWSARDEANALRAREIFAQEFERASLGRLVIRERVALHSSVHHHMGATRMHRDPRKGVVDENCRVHGVSNLFVAGSSIFPTGGYANPTLTLVALALRLADHLQEGCGK